MERVGRCSCSWGGERKETIQDAEKSFDFDDKKMG